MNFKKSSLALAILLSMSPVVWNAGHVQAQVISEANNRGDLFREQLRNAQDGSEIQLTGDTYLLRGEGAFDINKNVTIKGNGHMLHLEGYDLSLGADVTFQNVRLSLKPSQNLDTIFGGGFEQQETLVGKIFANGHKLVLDNVDTQVNGASDNSRPMVILGSRTPETSNAGHGELNVINSGYKTKLFAVWAGGNSEQDEEQATTITLNDVSFVDSRVRKTDQGVVVGSLGDKNYTGEVNITISGTDNSLKSFDTETNTNVSLTLKSKLSGDGVLDLGVMPTLKNLTLESSDTVTVEHLNVTDTLTLKNGARLQTPPFPQETIYITVNNINAENGEIIAEEKQGRAAYVNVTGTISSDSHLKITGEHVTFSNSAYSRNADNTVVLGNTANNADGTNTATETAPTETPPADNTGTNTENTGSTSTTETAPADNTGSTGTTETTPAENTGESAGTGETNQPVNGGDSTPSEQPSNGGNGTSNGETSTDGTNANDTAETPPADNTGTSTENTGTTETQPTDNTGSTGTTETIPAENTGENSGTGETNQPVNGGDSTPSEQPSNGDNGTSNGETSTDGTNANDTAETPPADNTGTNTENSGSTETQPTDNTGTTETTPAETQPSENTGSTGATETTPAENTGENSGTGETNQPVNGGDSTPSEQPSNGGNGTSNGETSTDGTNATGSTETPPADNAGTSTENSGSTETQPTENTGSTGATETTPTENTGESAGTGEAGQSDTRPANEADTTTGSTTPTDGTSGNTTATGTNTDNTAASSGNTNNEADGNASSNDDTSPFVLQPEENVYSAVNKATYTAATTYFALYSIHQRLNGLRLHEWTKQTTDDMSLPVKQEGLWVNTKYHRIRQSHGYQLNLRGLQLGYDDVVSHGNSTLRWGVAADLEQGNTDFVDSSAQLKTKHYGVSLYGSYEMDKRHYLDMVIRAGRLSSKLNHAVESKYGQNQYSAFVAYGQSIPLADAWLLEPQVQLAYAHLTGVNHQQGDLQVNAQSVNSLVGGVGAKLAFHLTPNAEIYGKTMLHREFAGTQKWEMARTTSHNHGTYQLNNRATWGTLGLGLQAKWRDDVAVRFEFDKVMGNGHQNSHQIHFGVNWRF